MPENKTAEVVGIIDHRTVKQPEFRLATNTQFYSTN